MPIERAALLMEPVVAMASRRAALPGPMAVASPRRTRRRGFGDIKLLRLRFPAQTFEASLQIGDQIRWLLQAYVQPQHRPLGLPGAGSSELLGEGRNGQAFIAAPRVAEAEVCTAMQHLRDLCAGDRLQFDAKEAARTQEVPLPDFVSRMIR